MIRIETLGSSSDTTLLFSLIWRRRGLTGRPGEGPRGLHQAARESRRQRDPRGPQVLGL